MDKLTPARQLAQTVAGHWPRLRLLMAEDNKTSRLMASEILHIKNIQVDVGANGLEAIRLASSNSYHAILMDIQMPELDGLETARRIRRAHSAVPIITMPEDVRKNPEAGMQDQVSKPVEPKTLHAPLRYRRGREIENWLWYTTAGLFPLPPKRLHVDLLE